MKKLATLSILTTALVLTGCDTIWDDMNRDPLVGPQWQLVAIERPGQRPYSLRPGESDRHWVRFSSDSRAQFGLDCNNGNGSWYRVGGETGATYGGIEIGEIAATRALCPEPSYGEEMAAALPLANRYELLDNNRTLAISTRTATYRFQGR